METEYPLNTVLDFSSAAEMNFALKNNRILKSDSYKQSHFLQYPTGTEYVYSYIESRGGEHNEQVFFGLQMFLKEWMTRAFTLDEIMLAKAIVESHGLPFNTEGWRRVVEECNGWLPIEIKAVPEGTIVPAGNVLVTVTNTKPGFGWVVSFFETMFLRAVWYPVTVATTSWRIKKIIKSALEKTGDVDGLPFKLHDFGARGVSSGESAMIGGLAHLVNFQGTDTLEAIVGAKMYYDCAMAGFSIPASEHSTMTILGREGESEQMERMIDQFSKEGAIFACVSDSYDIFNACENIWGDKLRQKIIDKKGILVVRPDSGDPAAIVLSCLQALDSKFGHTFNEKGYKVLNNVRVIQGDGINENSIVEIINRFTTAGYSADNVAFGMGGALLQHMNRDTNKFAMKASAARIDGEWVDVFKDPITDKGKRSKKGRLALVDDVGGLMTVREEIKEWRTDLLRPVFRDGCLLVDESLDEIRERVVV